MAKSSHDVYIQFVILQVADDCTGRERDSHVAEGASSKDYESLRQKDSYRTQLWRALYLLTTTATKGESQNVITIDQFWV